MLVYSSKLEGEGEGGAESAMSVVSFQCFFCGLIRHSLNPSQLYTFTKKICSDCALSFVYFEGDALNIGVKEDEIPG
jgi:hypothetical protein